MELLGLGLALIDRGSVSPRAAYDEHPHLPCLSIDGLSASMSRSANSVYIHVLVRPLGPDEQEGVVYTGLSLDHGDVI